MTKLFKTLFSNKNETYAMDNILHIEDDYYHPTHKHSNQLSIYYLCQI